MVGAGYPRSPCRGLPVRGSRVFITALGGPRVAIWFFCVRRLTRKLYVVCAALVIELSSVSLQCGSVSSAVGRIHQYLWLLWTYIHGRSLFVICFWVFRFLYFLRDFNHLLGESFSVDHFYLACSGLISKRSSTKKSAVISGTGGYCLVVLRRGSAVL